MKYDNELLLCRIILWTSTTLAYGFLIIGIIQNKISNSIHLIIPLIIISIKTYIILLILLYHNKEEKKDEITK